MKKVGIITLLSTNYGAVLQAYATAKVVQRLGYSANLLNYNDRRRITYSLSAKRKILFYGRKAVAFLITGNKKKRRFDTFRKQYLPLSSPRISDRAKLAAIARDYDLFMSGSDQIWNPALFAFDYSYMLDFVPNDIPKVSYASSFGKPYLPEIYQEKCGKLLSRYAALSVREKSGADIIQQLTGKEATVCLDPTLLLSADDWNELACRYTGKNRDKSYVVVYMMPGDPVVETALDTLACTMSEKSGVPIIRLGTKEHAFLKYGFKENNASCGVEEFLHILSHAACVVTNSFHGTAFSLNFGKPVYVPINTAISTEGKLHERMLSLTGILGVEDILIPCDQLDAAKTPATWGHTDAFYTDALNAEREKSLHYLKDALETCEYENR